MHISTIKVSQIISSIVHGNVHHYKCIKNHYVHDNSLIHIKVLKSPHPRIDICSALEQGDTKGSHISGLTQRRGRVGLIVLYIFFLIIPLPHFSIIARNIPSHLSEELNVCRVFDAVLCIMLQFNTYVCSMCTESCSVSCVCSLLVQCLACALNVHQQAGHSRRGGFQDLIPCFTQCFETLPSSVSDGRLPV